MKYEGDLEITSENQDKFKNLIEVTGYVRVEGSAKLDAPKLKNKYDCTFMPKGEPSND